ncbi:MAG: serine/threonine-protein kinase, partial [Bryobacterales bacterium]|nr:serine/threonine-protein kinase [Bryobacterales bacterium]
MSLEIGARLGPYEVLAQLGEGEMGEVYRATDMRLVRTVALKVLFPALTGDADYMARFTREAHILASFNHPNTAVIHGLEESGGTRALVMELIEGRNLAEGIAAGSFGLEETPFIAKQIAEALEAAHDKGIVHRDLKPANIMLTPEGVVKVLDFGLAKQAETRTSSGDTAQSLTVRATQAGVVMGTAGYMSPEQAAARSADRRADIWAFGVVLWELLCRKPLFSGESIAYALAEVSRAEIELNKLPADTPVAIRELIRRCLERDVKKRLQAIGEARIAIERYLANPSPAEVVDTVAEGPVRAGRSRRPWAIAAVASIVAVSLAVVPLRETPPAERVFLDALPPPEKSVVHTLAVSPDGRYLAVAVEKAGQQRLWVRPRNGLVALELHDTEDTMYPFWSPDSRTIGFFAAAKLKKVGVDGAPPQVLCDAPEGRGGTWNRDGVIVFAPSNDGVLQRVSAMGGVPVAVTQRKGTAVHRFPAFLPDGRRFFYSENLGDRDGMYVGSLDGQPACRSLNDRSSAIYQPSPSEGEPGYLMFQRQRTLMAQPLREKTLENAGELFPVTEGIVLANVDGAIASVSENGVLVYWSISSRLESSQLTWYDRSGKALGSVGSPGALRGFALSRGEKSVVFRRDVRLQSDHWLYEMERGVETRFTFRWGINAGPVWSPDSKRILYSSNRGGPLELVVKDTSGAGQEDGLQKTNNQRVAGDWSRDGRTVVYRVSRDRWVVNMDGERVPSIFLRTPFDEVHAKFSPDGPWIAYASDESGKMEVYARPFPGGAGKWKISGSGGTSPRWSHKGTA